MADAHPHARRKTLEEWESWVDKAIKAEARERGEFNNLPGHGKPLGLEENPFADGREVSFGILKNAGMAPYWVELNKEIAAAAEQLELLIGRATEIASEPRSSGTNLVEEPVPKRRWWQIFRYVEPARSYERQEQMLRAELGRLRVDFLTGTDTLNQKIPHYNASIPRELWHLERTVRTLADAAREFDGVCS